MNKVLVFGRDGQLAKCLAESPPTTIDVTFVSREEADFMNAPDFGDLIATYSPNLVLIAAAYTSVDQAEYDVEAAYLVNAIAVGVLAKAAQRVGIPIVHVSTDYVFPGDTADGAYSEEDATRPIGVYGRTKLEGERLLLAAHDQAYVFRTSWVYSAYRNNFLKTMLSLGETNEELAVVDDQYGTPTSAHDLATALWSAIKKLLNNSAEGVPPGIYHMAASGYTTWYGFAIAIFEKADAMGWHTPDIVRPVATNDFPTIAKRPAYSRLETSKLAIEFGLTLPAWHDGIQPVLDRLR